MLNILMLYEMLLQILRNLIYILNRLQNSDTAANVRILTWGTRGCLRSNLITKPAKMRIIFLSSAKLNYLSALSGSKYLPVLIAVDTA